jgi:hypothetical protein
MPELPKLPSLRIFFGGMPQERGFNDLSRGYDLCKALHRKGISHIEYNRNRASVPRRTASLRKPISTQDVNYCNRLAAYATAGRERFFGVRASFSMAGLPQPTFLTAIVEKNAF